MRHSWLFAFFAACSSPSRLQIELLVEEGTTWASNPTVTTLAIDLRTSTNSRPLLETAATEGSVTIPPVEVKTASKLVVSGYDASKKRIATGSSIPFLGSDVAGYTLRVLVQRGGRAISLPGTLATAPATPVLAVMNARTLAFASSSSTQPVLEMYDLATYQPLSTRFTLSSAPASLLAQGDRILLVDGTRAEWLDTAAATFEQATLPTGALTGDLSGGKTWTTDDGVSLLVGATRAAGAPTKQVLVVETDTMRIATLATPRLGAGATWVPGVGLVVCGGASALPALELLAPNASAAVTLATPVDPADARACATLASGRVLVAGGKLPDGTGAPTWLFDPKCKSDCAPTVWPSPAEVVAAPQLAAIGSLAFLVGQDSSGNIVGYELGASAATAIALPTKRTTAAITLLPTGAIGIVGGASRLDQFVPTLD